jgi:enamine deaminase RidA (YjgF/YER057c/UK114 family)
MWILKWLPDFVFHLIFIAGLLGLTASLVFKFIPFVAQYRIPIQVAASILIAVGLYMEGAISDNTAWVDRVHQMEKKVAEAEAKSAEANTQLVTELARNREKIAANQAAVKQAIQQNIQAINRQCKLTDVSVELYNQAVRGGTQ